MGTLPGQTGGVYHFWALPPLCRPAFRASRRTTFPLLASVAPSYHLVSPNKIGVPIRERQAPVLHGVIAR
jgi:hypothetical protein